jgi:hypothetical protein
MRLWITKAPSTRKLLVQAQGPLVLPFRLFEGRRRHRAVAEADGLR